MSWLDCAPRTCACSTALSGTSSKASTTRLGSSPFASSPLHRASPRGTSLPRGCSSHATSELAAEPQKMRCAPASSTVWRSDCGPVRQILAAFWKAGVIIEAGRDRDPPRHVAGGSEACSPCAAAEERSENTSSPSRVVPSRRVLDHDSKEMTQKNSRARLSPFSYERREDALMHACTLHLT